ncbi:hypothetical protein HF086_011396 [Spodoptera exigua]|uniref:MADF domain-containing protein n=1 Tax=Spodoptera exigua TaxID=7107 RepID=A0A922SU48_SPOEX|nr:hypothetical protein HF086_015358 [Spodoptera exigua]KAH9645934.1 hypothetical protein HF086_011396 [Spodoptera exigua]
MANNITPEVLIPLVEQRAVLWDKTLDVYKDKGLKLAAWREICCVFEPNFDKLEEKERKDFVTEPRMTSDSSNEPNNSISDTLSDAAPSTQKKTKTDTLDDKMSQFLDYKLNNQEHPHVSFIKGILPSLASFDNDDNFEFQTGYFTQDPDASTSTSNQVMEPAASPNSVYTNLSDNTQDSFNFDNI